MDFRPSPVTHVVHDFNPGSSRDIYPVGQSVSIHVYKHHFGFVVGIIDAHSSSDTSLAHVEISTHIRSKILTLSLSDIRKIPRFAWQKHIAGIELYISEITDLVGQSIPIHIHKCACCFILPATMTCTYITCPVKGYFGTLGIVGGSAFWQGIGGTESLSVGEGVRHGSSSINPRLPKSSPRSGILNGHPTDNIGIPVTI